MTAVEFLHSKYMKIFGELNPSTGKLFEIAYALEQAKEMEKYQIMSAHTDGVDSGYQYAKNDDIYIKSENFLNTCNSTKYYNLVYNTENKKATD